MTQRTLCSMAFALVLALMGCEGTSSPGSIPEQVDALSAVQSTSDSTDEPAADSWSVTEDNDASAELDADDADDADGEMSGPLPRRPDPTAQDATAEETQGDASVIDIGPQPTCLSDSECQSAGPCTHGVCYEGECIQVMHSPS